MKNKIFIMSVLISSGYVISEAYPSLKHDEFEAQMQRSKSATNNIDRDELHRDPREYTPLNYFLRLRMTEATKIQRKNFKPNSRTGRIAGFSQFE